MSKEIVKQEALESWAMYQETGLHVTGEEAREWLSRWGTDDESEIPACHKGLSSRSPLRNRKALGGFA